MAVLYWTGVVIICFFVWGDGERVIEQAQLWCTVAVQPFACGAISSRLRQRTQYVSPAITELTDALLPLMTLLLSLSFMFANTAKTLLESFIFIVIVKPYDVGDRVNVRARLTRVSLMHMHNYDSYVLQVGEERFVVKSVQLLTTTFRTVHNKQCQISNSVLSHQHIYNFARSPNACFEIQIQVDW